MRITCRVSSVGPLLVHLIKCDQCSVWLDLLHSCEGPRAIRPSRKSQFSQTLDVSLQSVEVLLVCNLTWPSSMQKTPDVGFCASYVSICNLLHRWLCCATTTCSAALVSDANATLPTRRARGTSTSSSSCWHPHHRCSSSCSFNC